MHGGVLSSPVTAAEQADAAPTDRNRPRPFNLTRWFALVSLISIVVLVSVSAVLVSRLFVEQMLRRDAEVGMAFIQSLTRSARADSYFSGPATAPDARRMEEFFERITTMPDVLRANVYTRNRTIIWSSNPQAIGRQFELNPELDAALRGELSVEADILEHRSYMKPEHVFFGSTMRDFVENYIPVWDEQNRQVIGVVELYKEPRALYQTLRRAMRLIWLCALLGGLLLFGGLFWIVRRADRVITQQAAQLAANESFTAIGEMTAVVAHGIRNPLSSIRSSAELLGVTHGAAGREHCIEIMQEVDRIELGVRSLVTYTQVTDDPTGRVDVNELAQDAIAEFTRDAERLHIAIQWRLGERLPSVKGDAALLRQVFASLIANAIEAMPGGGTLTVRTARAARADHGDAIELSIDDTGIGIAPDQLERLFVPFQSTKKHGMGVGLPLVRRVLQRFGGTIAMRSQVGIGTSATVTLKAA